MWSSTQSSKIKLAKHLYNGFRSPLSPLSSSSLSAQISFISSPLNLYKCHNHHHHHHHHRNQHVNNIKLNQPFCTYNSSNTFLKRFYSSSYSNNNRFDQSDDGYYDFQITYETNDDDNQSYQSYHENNNNNNTFTSTLTSSTVSSPITSSQSWPTNNKKSKIDASSLPKIIKIKSKGTKASTSTSTTTTTASPSSNDKDSIIQSIFGVNTIQNDNNNNKNNSLNITSIDTTSPKQQSSPLSMIKEEEGDEEIKTNTKKKKSRKSSSSVDEDSDMDIELTDEQKAIVRCIVEGGKNVFFTGSAGTGKSVVIKHTVSQLREKYGPNSVYVTAASGIAAVNIGGVTLHSFAGIGYGHGTATQLAVNISKKKKYQKRWNDCKVLIIDEISMIDAELFDKLEEVARLVKNNDLPFGGIQLFLCGDFFQLPPVQGNYAFESEAWQRCITMNLELQTVMRQKDDSFIKILNKLRKGQVFKEAIELLSSCKRPLDVSNGVLPTKLYTTNADVDSENNVALEALPGENVTFTSVDSGCKELIEALDKDCPAPRELNLKIGAQVVLLRKPEGQSKLVNGSRGVVVDFVEPKAPRSLKSKTNAWAQQNALLPVVLFNDGSRVRIKPSEWGIWSEKKATRQQLPLKLAWALTIHRAQGLTLDKIECRLQQAFANGQAYVALSRAKTLEGLYLEEFSKSSIRTSQKVVEFEKKFLKSSTLNTTFKIKF